MEALLIVDMQSGFSAAHNKRTIAACQKLILKAKKDKALIIVLEYNGHGHTLPQLVELIEDYPNRHFLVKTQDDGSFDVHNFLTAKGIRIMGINVCGVNSDACVQFTSETLAEMGYNVFVIKKACNTYHKRGKGWNEYAKLDNLRKI